MKYDIFISYRRKDSSGKSNVPTARQFKLAFEAPPYNYRVFFDYSECTDNYFSDTILPAIRTCDFFVLVLTKDCLLRCSDEGDWVRREIEEAIAYNRKIIPITPDKECESFPSNLPDLLSKTFDGLQITTIYTDHMFEASVDFLVKNRFHLNKVKDLETEHKAKEVAERERKAKEDRRKAEEEVERARLEKERIERKETEKKAKEATETEEETTSVIGGHEYIDLGLPSGTLWATCNVGAEKPEDYGDYFAWGETKPKTTYHMGTYKYGNISDEVTKYCNDSKSGYDGFIDNLTALQSSDDPATVNWGSDWHTPSKEEWEELMNNTSNKWVIQNGVKGRLFTSKKNGRTIFLPAAGVRCDDEFDGDGDFGVYWSSSLYTDDPYFAWYFNVYSDGYDMNEGGRSEGQSVRPVCSARQN